MVQALRKTVWLFLKVKCTLTIGPTRVILQLLLWVKKKSCLDLVIPTVLTSTCCCSHSSPGMGLLPPITAGQSPEGLHSLSFFSALHTAAFSFIFLQLSLPLVLWPRVLLVSTNFLSALPPLHLNVSPSAAVFLQLLGSRQHAQVQKTPL